MRPRQYWTMTHDWRCILCGNEIGVYEPMLIVGEDGERETSRAAEPELVVGEERLYHSACLARHGNAAALATPVGLAG